ncbi:flagellar biosynthesis anti-sigma factor FlgM [Pantoea sp. MBD-2R]|uniref:flagellar biosynthesis anti-sigma factor FlgM n=1 Tax=Pantoea sp. MBD-2R TaxID=3141540 RepID=UPI00318305CB
MKISAENLIHTTSPINQVIASAVESPGQAAVSVAETGLVSQTQQALKAMPEVDLARVSEMKAALENGTLSLDGNVLAKAMMDYYRR